MSEKTAGAAATAEPSCPEDSPTLETSSLGDAEDDFTVASTTDNVGDEIEDGFDVQTHGGGQLEAVPGFAPSRGMVEGLGSLASVPIPADAAEMEDEDIPESVCDNDDRVRISQHYHATLAYGVQADSLPRLTEGGVSGPAGLFRRAQS